jgi:hypothetical protein
MRNWTPGDFEGFVLDGPVRDGPFLPVAHYDRDGDCLEVVLADESFRGVPVGGGITAYLGRGSGTVVGCLVEGIGVAPGCPDRPA